MKLKFLPLAVAILLIGAKWLNAQDLEFVQDPNNYYYYSGDSLFEEVFLCDTPFLYMPSVTGGIPNYDFTSSAERLDGDVFIITPENGRVTEYFTASDGQAHETLWTNFYSDLFLDSLPQYIEVNTGRYYLYQKPFYSVVMGEGVYFDQENGLYYIQSDSIEAGTNHLTVTFPRANCENNDSIPTKEFSYVAYNHMEIEFFADRIINDNEYIFCGNIPDSISYRVTGGVPPYEVSLDYGIQPGRYPMYYRVTDAIGNTMSRNDLYTAAYGAYELRLHEDYPSVYGYNSGPTTIVIDIFELTNFYGYAFPHFRSVSLNGNEISQTSESSTESFIAYTVEPERLGTGDYTLEVTLQENECEPKRLLYHFTIGQINLTTQSVEVCEGDEVVIPFDIRGGTPPYSLRNAESGRVLMDNIQTGNNSLFIGNPDPTDSIIYAYVEDVQGIRSLDIDLHFTVHGRPEIILPHNMPETVYVSSDTIAMYVPRNTSIGGAGIEFMPNHPDSDEYNVYYFNPSAAGAGTHEVVFEAYDEFTGCESRQVERIVVMEAETRPLSINFTNGNELNICGNDYNIYEKQLFFTGGNAYADGYDFYRNGVEMGRMFRYTETRSNRSENVIYSIRDEDGNWAYDTLWVTIIDYPIVYIEDATIHEGEAYQFVPQLESRVDSYRWSNGSNDATIEAWEEGYYYVTVTNSNGCSAYDSAYLHVLPIDTCQLTGEFTATEVNTNQYFFQASNEADNYIWMIDGERVLEGRNSLSYLFINEGTHSVRLFVERGQCQAAYEQNITIHCYANAEFLVTHRSDFNYVFEALYPADYYIWNFGGERLETESVTAEHAFPSEGTYTIELVAIRGNCLDTITRRITIDNYSCQINAAFQLEDLGYGNYVFTAERTEGRFLWYINGEFIESGRILNTTFDVSGTYNIKLEVNNDTCSATDSIDVQVHLPEICSAEFISTQITWNSYHFEASNIADNYLWSINGVEQFRESNVFAYEFPEAGSYAVQLVTITGNCVDTIVREILINANTTCNLTARFESDKIDFETYRFTATVEADLYSWNIDNRLYYESRSNFMEVIFTSSDSVDVTLIVKQGDCYDTVTVTIYVEVGNPCSLEADFTIENTHNNYYEFTSLVSADTYAWRINGEELPRSAFSVEYMFTESGMYSIQLVVSRDDCTDSITKREYIEVESTCGQDIDFEYSTEDGRTYTFSPVYVYAEYKYLVEGEYYYTNDSALFSYTFPEPGLYPVTFWRMYGDCTDSLTKWIDVEGETNGYYIQGYVYNCCQPINCGKVVAYKIEGHEYIPMDTVNLQPDGSYVVQNLPEGTYTVAALPCDTEEYSKTFFVHSLVKENATRINLIGNATSVDIILLPVCCITEINDPADNSLKAYPIPVTDQLNISSDYLLDATITISNIAGIIVYQTVSSSNEFSIDTELLGKGVFIIRAEKDTNQTGSITITIE